jgi:eukaryotic translation initiation factor 2C
LECTIAVHSWSNSFICSLIPPAYYADIACERGRLYINEFFSGDAAKAGKRGRQTKDQVFDAAKHAWRHGVHEDLKESMFYL